MTVRLRDGIEIGLSDGLIVSCDADEPAGDVAVVSHAHGDHYPEGETTAVCSPLTADLATVRRGVPLRATEHPRITLLPAGHVAGSRAAVIDDPDGTRYLYTGDVCTRSRFYLEGFDPPAADVLIIEATYGTPEYCFPDHDAVAAEIEDWLSDTQAPVVLFGYALGRAQKLQRLAVTAGRSRLFTTDAVLRVNEVVAEHLDVEFDARAYDDAVTLQDGDALVLPMTSARIEWVEDLVTDAGAVTAGFSGWAVDTSFRFRGNYDATFPLSDHCDYRELRALVDAVDPEQVYTHHGAADVFARELTTAGYDATALKENQSTLGDF
ncbi:MAG: MBL fold metallo-hydrolase RNA specificity domain-containing protein [Halobacteriaceae archaeon]